MLALFFLQEFISWIYILELGQTDSTLSTFVENSFFVPMFDNKQPIFKSIEIHSTSVRIFQHYSIGDQKTLTWRIQQC